jgi:hypothetical protein
MSTKISGVHAASIIRAMSDRSAKGVLYNQRSFHARLTLTFIEMPYTGDWHGINASLNLEVTYEKLLCFTLSLFKWYRECVHVQ